MFCCNHRGQSETEIWNGFFVSYV